MQPVHILAVEDEAAIQTLIRFNLEQAGFSVQCAGSVAEAQSLLAERLPDVLLLDWMLPDTDGVAFAARLRANARTADLPIILLTARGSEEDKEAGLNRGADDYLTKPFSPRELVARIHALLRRRAPQKTARSLVSGSLKIDPAAQSVSGNGREIILSSSEFKLLHFFATHPGRVYSRRQLLDAVWGDHVFVEERTVDVHIARLRRLLEAVGGSGCVQTVRGSGYRFSADGAES